MVDLSLDGMEPSEETTEVASPETDTDNDAGSDGAMILEGITQNDGASIEEAINRIIDKRMKK